MGDYHIIKINYYASKYLLKKWKSGDQLPKQHWDNAKLYVEFFWQFFEKASGYSRNEWFKKYFTLSKECALEYLEAELNIYIAQYRDGVYTYIIPKTNNDLYEWCLANIKNKYTIGKKCNLPLHIRYGTSYDKNYWRNLSKSDNFNE